MLGTETAPLPVSLVGGFLGAGKTTLLNGVLSAQHDKRIAVLVNDFGRVNIDSQLVVSVEDEVIDLANGCICCSLRGDLLEACLKLLERPDPPEAFLVETSGVSDLGDVVRAFDQPQVQGRLRLDAVMVVADCETLDQSLGGRLGALLSQQLAAADLVILNKCDLVGPEGLRKARSAIDAVAPGIAVLATRFGILPEGLAMATDLTRPRRPSRLTGHQAAGHGMVSFHWTSDRPLSLPKLRRVLEQLPPEVYRAKGFVYLEELPPYRILLQKVGRRYNLRDQAAWGACAPRSEIVAIATADCGDPAIIERAFEAAISDGEEAGSQLLQFARRIAPELYPSRTAAN